jgi:protein TonB
MKQSKRWLLVAGALLAANVHAQADAPATTATGLIKPAPSDAADARAYRADAARHIYQSYRLLVHPGQLPPLLQGVAILETTIDTEGLVEKVEVVREPAARAITPWLVAMIHAAQPFPAAPRQGRVVYRDIWLVTSEGRFQLDAITEGQVHLGAAAQR